MRINPKPPTSWRDLQNQAARILTESGLKAEVEKTITTARGTVNVDVYAIDETQRPPPVCLCECKHWTASVPKNVVHGFRTVLTDFGASWGFLISSAGFQSGAFEAAEFSNVRLMTWQQFEDTWMERWTETYLRPKLYEAQERLCGYTEPLLGTGVCRRLDAISPERQGQFKTLRKNPSKVLPAELALHLGAPWHKMMGNTDFNLPLNKRTPAWALECAPAQLVATESLREFGEILCKWVDEVTAEFDAVFAEE